MLDNVRVVDYIKVRTTKMIQPGNITYGELTPVAEISAKLLAAGLAHSLASDDISFLKKEIESITYAIVNELYTEHELAQINEHVLVDGGVAYFMMYVVAKERLNQELHLMDILNSIVNITTQGKRILVDPYIHKCGNPQCADVIEKAKKLMAS